jgi:hypothetical protein
MNRRFRQTQVKRIQKTLAFIIEVESQQVDVSHPREPR